MKLPCLYYQYAIKRRTPRGVRGLKQRESEVYAIKAMSHPARGAWIETPQCLLLPCYRLSHPAWGAWIETYKSSTIFYIFLVAPREGCVD